MSRSGGQYSLLELDPDLDRLLVRERWAAARDALFARVVSVPVGEWDVSGLVDVSASNVGLLVIDGVIARELTLEGNVSTELLGAGDLVRPRALDDSARLVESATCLNPLAPVRVTVLDQALAIRHAAFPEHTNVEFAFVHDGVIHARVWERGIGETMACGSGACAVLVAANEAGLVPSHAVVSFPGGDLDVERRDDGEVLLAGPAVRVFDGSVDPRLLVGP